MTLPAADDRAGSVVETLVESLADGVVVVRDDGRVVGADGVASHLLGLSDSGRLREASGPAAAAVRELVARARETGGAAVLNGEREPGSPHGVAIPLDDSVYVGLRADGERPATGPATADGHYRNLVRAVGDPLYMLDRAGRFTFVNEALVEITGYPASDLLGTHVSLVMDPADIEQGEHLIRDILRDPDHETGVFEMDTIAADGRRVRCENHVAVLVEDGRFTGTAGVVRDITERQEREAQLTRQRNELARLNHINAVVRGIVQTLVDPTSKAGLERAVCERLASPGPYAAAWFGELDVGDGRLSPVAVVGIDETVLEDHDVRLDADPPGASAEAARTKRVVVTVAESATCDADDFPASEADDDTDGTTVADECAQVLAELGLGACAAIPVYSGDGLYGVLHVYSHDAAAFDDEEVAVLHELGRIIGSTHRARLTEQLLHSDDQHELVFHVPDTDLALVAAATELDATLVLDRYVPTEGPVALYYGRLLDGDPKDLAALLADDPEVDRLRVVGADSEGAAFEFCFEGPFAAVEFGSLGMEFRGAEVRPGALFLRTSLAPGTPVRAAAAAVSAAFPAAELVAQRRVDREPTTAHDFRADVFTALTPRQRAALDAAVHAGYFDWPRGSTAEEVATAMGISAATFHSHLRKAQGKLLDALYETNET